MQLIEKYLLNFNWWWRVIHLIAILFVLGIAAYKLFGWNVGLHHPTHIDFPSEDDLMLEWNKENKTKTKKETKDDKASTNEKKEEIKWEISNNPLDLIERQIPIDADED